MFMQQIVFFFFFGLQAGEPYGLAWGAKARHMSLIRPLLAALSSMCPNDRDFAVQFAQKNTYTLHLICMCAYSNRGGVDVIAWNPISGLEDLALDMLATPPH